MKRVFLFAILIASSLIAFSQESGKKDFTLEDAVLKGYSQYYPEYISGLKWRKSTDDLIKNSDNYRAVLTKGIKDKNWDTLLTVSTINKSLDLDMKYLPSMKWLAKNTILFKDKRDYYKFDIENLKGSKFASRPAEGSNFSLCRKTGNIAFTIDNNLYVLYKDGDSIPVTKFEDKNIVVGQSIARNEFGISKGIFWSPKGNYLAFYQKDESKITDYPLVDITTPTATLKNIKYPMAGQKSEYPKVGIYDVKSKTTIYLNTERKDHYLTNLGWGPNEKYVYVAILNREQNHMKLTKFDVSTGELVKVLFEEKHDKYVEPEHPVWFIPGNDNEFLWYSERDGFDHLYRYNTEGELLNQVTKGDFEIHEILGLDKEGKHLYVTGTDETGLNEYLYKAKLTSDKIKKITKEKGVHSYEMQEGGKYFIDIYSALNTPHITRIINNKGKEVAELLKSDNPTKDLKMGTTELLEIKAADGETTLNARMIKPYDFDPSKKYKVFVYLYGGPHAQMVRNAWMGYAPMWMHYFANQGYIVFTIDNRGSSNRGLNFENVIHRELSKVEIEDQMKGVDYLKSLPYVDTTKMAIHGWSFGGFMTSSIMLKKPKVFKVGVAGGPVTNWNYYEVMYGERYMDKPEENPEGYEATNLTKYVDNLEGDLLLIIGSIDPVVVPQHSYALIKSFVEAGKQVDFFSYPMHEHNVRGRDRLHLIQKIYNYVQEKLD